MSTYNDKTLKNVSETVMEILSEGSSTSRKPWRDINSPESKAARKDLFDRMDREKAAEPGKALLAKIKSKKQRNEEIEANEEILDEADETKTSKGRIVKTATGVRHYGSYGTSHYEAPQKKEKPKQSDDASLSDEEFRQKHGMSRKNYERMKTGVKIGESFTEMLEAYDQYGLAVFAKELTEEPDNETFTKEVERQKRKAAGTAPESELADVAAAAGKEHKIKEEVEQIDERSLSDEENKKKEDYVKGMKKKMKAFKERYGKNAKSVMYATATKMAKGD